MTEIHTPSPLTPQQMTIECDYLDNDARCEGLYKGFGCIKDKCQQPSKIKPEACSHMRHDGFCEKLGKLSCIGEKNCMSFEL